MTKQYDESDMPRIADAYDFLEDLWFSGDYRHMATCLDLVAKKYNLTEREQERILGWLEDEIATQAGDAEGQIRLDQDH